MIYYSAIRRNRVLIHATIWMIPESIMLSKISQTKKDHTKVGVGGGLVREMGSYFQKGQEFLFEMMKKY